MNKSLINESRKDLDTIREYLQITTQSTGMHTPYVTTRLLKLRDTLQKAKKEAELIYREALSI